MGIATTYSLQNLTPAATLHPGLKNFYLTPEAAEPIQKLLDSTTGTSLCVIPIWDWTCWSQHSHTEARDRMVQFLKQMDTTLNPHRLLTTPNTETQPSVRVLDPRLGEIIRRFLPTLPAGEGYSIGEMDAAATQFADMARQSGLDLFATTSPCRTSDTQSLTCMWSNSPNSADESIWLKPGELIHPKLAGTHFTQRASAGLRALLQRAASPAAQATLAELVLDVDNTFSPYCMTPKNHIVMDGSVDALESMIDQNAPADPNHLTDEYTRNLCDIFREKADHFSAAGISHMTCDVNMTPSTIADTPFQITCGYITTTDPKTQGRVVVW